MYMIDAVGKLFEKRGRIEKLMHKMARVKIDTEAGTVANRVERFARRHKIVGDLSGMN